MAKEAQPYTGRWQFDPRRARGFRDDASISSSLIDVTAVDDKVSVKATRWLPEPVKNAELLRMGLCCREISLGGSHARPGRSVLKVVEAGIPPRRELFHPRAAEVMRLTYRPDRRARRADKATMSGRARVSRGEICLKSAAAAGS